MYSLFSLITGMKKNCSLYTEKECKFPFTMDVKNQNSKVVIITGDNASGKSLLLKVLKNYAKKTFNIKSIMVSLKEQLNPLGVDQTEQRRMVCLKDDLNYSTGVSSVESVKRSFDIMKKWTQDSDTIILLEEPEIGLAQGYEYALGQFIAENTLKEKDNEAFSGLIIITHSKNVMKGILEQGVEPIFINMGKDFISMENWLNIDDKKTVGQLLELLKPNKYKTEEIQVLSHKLKKAS